MATYAVTRQPRLGVARPTGGRPVVINWDSPQARGLSDLFLGRTGPTVIRRRPVSRVGTFASLGRGVQAPLNDVLWEYDQSGGNLSGATFDATGLSASDALTISAWVYLTQAPGAGRGLWELGSANWSLAVTHSLGTNGLMRAHVVTTSGGAAQFNTGDTTTALAAFTPLLATAVWNPGSGLTLYVNGRSEASNATATTGLRDVDAMRVYAAPSVAVAAGLEGCLSDLRIYRRALTAAEVWALYDPQTRWDLYWQSSTRIIFDIAAVGGGTRPSGMMLLGVR